MHVQRASWITCRRLFSFFIAPLVRNRACSACCGRAPPPPGGVWGLLAGTLSLRSDLVGYGCKHRSESALSYHRACHPDAKDMAENMYRALWSWMASVSLVTVLVSYMPPKPEARVAELAGLVYGVSLKSLRNSDLPTGMQRPIFVGRPSCRRGLHRDLKHHLLVTEPMHKSANDSRSGGLASAFCYSSLTAS